MPQDPAVPERIGKNIQRLRKLRDLTTQEELAGRAGLGLSRLKEIEAGRWNPTLDTLIRITQALDVDFSELTATSSGSRAASGKNKVLERLAKQLERMAKELKRLKD